MAVDVAGRRVGIGAGRSKFGMHIREFTLDELVMSNGGSELFANVGVRENEIKGGLHDPKGLLARPMPRFIPRSRDVVHPPKRTSTENKPLQIKTFHQDLDPAVYFA